MFSTLVDWLFYSQIRSQLICHQQTLQFQTVQCYVMFSFCNSSFYLMLQCFNIRIIKNADTLI